MNFNRIESQKISAGSHWHDYLESLEDSCPSQRLTGAAQT